jgi:hypothetical protein
VPSKYGCVQNKWRKPERQEHVTSVKKCSGYAIEEKVNCTCPSPGKVVTSDWTTCVLNQILGPGCGKGEVLSPDYYMASIISGEMADCDWLRSTFSGPSRKNKRKHYKTN